MWIRSLAHMAQMVFQWQLAAPWQFAENEVTSKASKSIYFYLILYICICILTMTSLKGKKPPFTLHILSVVAVLPRLAIFGPGSLALAPDTVEGRFLGGAAAFFPPFHHCHCQTIAKNMPHQIILSYGNHLWNWLVWKIPEHQQFFVWSAEIWWTMSGEFEGVRWNEELHYEVGLLPLGCLRWGCKSFPKVKPRMVPFMMVGDFRI